MTIEEAIDYCKFVVYGFQKANDEGLAFRILGNFPVAVNMAIEALQFQQSMVKCGECKLRYSYPNDKHCNRHIGKVCDDGFCFEGERREKQ